MFRSTGLILVGALFGAVSHAQIPNDLSFADLAKYLPYASASTGVILNSPALAAQVAAASNNITIFLTFDIPLQQFIATPPAPGVSPAALAIEAANAKNPTLNTNLFQFLQLQGLYSANALNGTNFFPTAFTSGPYNHISGGQKLGVFKNSTNFYIRSGIDFSSNVLITDIPFKGGLVHIVDHAAAPPYSLNDTGVVLNLPFLTRLEDNAKGHAPIVTANATTSDITVFAPAAGSARGSEHVTADKLGNYVVQGQVLYSPSLKDGTTVKSVGGGNIVVKSDGAGGITVNGAKVIKTDILTQEGVVHVIDGAFKSG